MITVQNSTSKNRPRFISYTQAREEIIKKNWEFGRQRETNELKMPRGHVLRRFLRLQILVRTSFLSFFIEKIKKERE